MNVNETVYSIVRGFSKDNGLLILILLLMVIGLFIPSILFALFLIGFFAFMIIFIVYIFKFFTK